MLLLKTIFGPKIFLSQKLNLVRTNSWSRQKKCGPEKISGPESNSGQGKKISQETKNDRQKRDLNYHRYV